MRPKKPYQYAVSITNYTAPGQPWNGQAIRSQPAADYWTPNTAKAAENYNYELGTISDDVNNLYTYLSQLSAASWPPVYPASSADSATLLFGDAPVYNAAIGLWMMGITRSSAPTNTIVFSRNGYDSWGPQHGHSRPTLTNPIDSIAVNPATGDAVALSVGGGAGHNFSVKYTASTGAFTEVTGFSTVVTQPGSVKIIYFGGQYVAISFYQPGNSGQVLSYVSTDGSTWVGSYGLGISTSAATSGGSLLTATNGSILLAVTNSHEVTSYSTTPDGSTWTALSLPSTFGTNERPWGLTYDSSTGLFYMTYASPTGSRLFTSPDGITWTQVSSTSGYAIYSIASDGGMLIGVATSNSGNTQCILVSIDKGVTWRWTQGRGVNNTGIVHSSGYGQFVYCDGNNVMANVVQVDLPPAVATFTS